MDTSMEKIPLGVSACLLGQKVRYDGGHKHDPYITDTLGEFFEFVPVCPEVECGLPVPREAMRLIGGPAAPRLVTVKSGVDHTDRMQAWGRKRLEELAETDLSGCIFKSRSPSSGMARVKVYNDAGVPSTIGTGIWARMFMDRFPLLSVEDEGRLHDPVLRENFIERVFVFRRWRELVRGGLSAAGLVSFHTRHKLLIMSHSVECYRALGKLAADPNRNPMDELQNRYITLLSNALSHIATVRRQVNVLQHIMGYFKHDLTSDEKQELLDIIGQYRDGLLPLIVPVTLLNHYVRKYDQPYLREQYYLNPHPLELKLRTHV